MNLQMLVGVLKGEWWLNPDFNGEMLSLFQQIIHTKMLLPILYAEFETKSLPAYLTEGSISEMDFWINLTVKFVEIGTKFDLEQLFKESSDKKVIGLEEALLPITGL